MILLGLICLVIALIAGIHLLWIIGGALIIIGLILLVLGVAGHAVFGRKNYW